MFEEQAKRWAIRYNGHGIVNEYKYQENNTLKILKFEEMTEEWLDFIVACRLGEKHDYDIVEGPMANDYIEMKDIPLGEFDNVDKCRYEVPDYWTIGEVYERLIEDSCTDDVIETLIQIYDSWISDMISNYNSDFYYQSREYIAECFKEGTLV